MPQTVIDAGLANVVAPAAALRERALCRARGLPLHVPEAVTASADPVSGILALLRSRHGTDFRKYKSATVLRRMQRRADLRGVPDLGHYGRLLGQDIDELDELYGDLLIEVTSFFRDAEAFERIAEKVMPTLIERLHGGESPRIWVAGCASGEEAYSLAILLAEHVEAAGVRLAANIIATDIHARSLERAAAGSYPAASVQHLSAERVTTYFEREGEQVRVRPALRRMVQFSTHDVIRDAPFARIDLLSCRNLLIYLNADTRAHVLARFQLALNAESWLFLGPSESVPLTGSGFESIDRKWCIFRKRGEGSLGQTRRPTVGDGRTLVPPSITGHRDSTLAERADAGHPASDPGDEREEMRPDALAKADDPAWLKRRVLTLEHELRASETRLQTTVEELETTNEELRSTNEELNFVNEELYALSAEHRQCSGELSELDDGPDGVPITGVDVTELTESYHRSLYRGVPVVMCLSDADGLVVEVSDEWLSHLDGVRETSLGTPFVDFLAEEDRDKALEAIRLGTADDLSLCVRRAGGELVEHEMSCRAHDVGTLRDMRLIVLSDVSERNRAMEKMERQNRRLANANKNLNQFAFVASHDLQEPLRKIQQFSSFLVEDLDGALDEDSRYHLKVIVDAAERMSALIRDLLQYSRTSRNALNRESVPLGALVDRVCRDLDLALEESRGRLEIGDLPEVSGDPMLLIQLFTNLIGNAIKYRSSSRPLLVRVWSEGGEHEGEDRRIVVEDNGIGFDPLYAKRMFEPFTRLHGSKDYRGSGIGLAICSAVCEKHGWRIEADGDPDRGSRFTITLGPPRAEGRVEA